MTWQFSNFAQSRLDGAIDDNDTTVNVLDGTVFPSSGDFVVRVDDELMLCTSRTGNALTVTRGQEGTTGVAHSNSSIITHVISKAVYDAFAQSAAVSVDHDDVTNVTADQHHGQSHAHNGLDSSGTVAHGDLTGVTSDQHHAEAHVHDEDDLTPDTVLVEEYVRFAGIYAAAMSGNLDNLAVGAVSIVRLNPSADFNLTGIVPTADNQIILIVNATTGDEAITLVHNATSTTTNRFVLPGNNNYKLTSRSAVLCWYDDVTDRWRIAAQGRYEGTPAAISTTGSAGTLSEMPAAGDHVHAHGSVGTVPDAHDAADITIADAGNDFTATDVEGALAELQSDHEADATALTDHTGDTTDAHDASAISIADSGGYFTGTDAEAALQELGASGGGGATIDVQVFSADGVWEKPENAVWVDLKLIGGGGGGGGGGRYGAGTAPGGGGGGQGGAFVEARLPASAVTDTVAVVAGTGGGGGDAAGINTTPGGDGDDGEDSSFGSYLVAEGGIKGGGGSSGASGTAGNGTTGSSPASAFGAPGGAGGNATVGSDGGDAPKISTEFRSGAGGGAGGGSRTTGAAARAGGVGGDAYRLSGGTSGSGTGPVAGGNGGTSISGLYQPGAGGGGGGSSASATGADGGSGGSYGGGGGGGGGSQNGNLSGAGGAGANGVVVVTTYCGTETSGGSFSPLSLASLEAWYDASSIAQADGTDVTSWPDLSGNGWTLTSAGTAPKLETAELNGKPVVRFAGTGRIGNGSFTASQPFSAFIVARSSSDTGGVQRLLGEGSGGNTLRVGYSWATDVWSINAGTGLTAAGADTSYHVFYVEFNTTDLFEVDAVSTISGDASTNGLNAGFFLGDFNGGTQPLTGDIAEALIFSAALSSGDKSDVYDYLNAKWGL